MKQVFIRVDEKWPVFDFMEDYRYSKRRVEVDEKTFSRWQRIMDQYNELQEELELLETKMYERTEDNE